MLESFVNLEGQTLTTVGSNTYDGTRAHEIQVERCLGVAATEDAPVSSSLAYRGQDRVSVTEAAPASHAVTFECQGQGGIVMCRKQVLYLLFVGAVFCSCIFWPFPLSIITQKLASLSTINTVKHTIFFANVFPYSRFHIDIV